MEKIQQLQDTFDAFISNCHFNGNPSELYDPIAYTLLQNGKRLRPMLCLLANDMFGGKVEDALWPALALETFHNFTLIHDDIMDQAPVRRGQPTVYKKWNANVAILSGDAMLAMAFQFALNTRNGTAAAQLLGRVAREVCEGQQFDLNYEKQDLVRIDEYLEMIRLKTAVLLATSLEMGATIADADDQDKRALYDFGIGIGTSFQLKDDILDLYSDVQVFGKRHGGDIADNKKTYLYLKAIELADKNDRKRLQQLFSTNIMHEEDEKIAEVKAIYDKLHVKEAVEDLMREYDRKAFAALDSIALPEKSKRHIKAYAEMLYGRMK